MPLPFTTLNSVTATGPGVAKDLEAVYTNHLIYAAASGGGQATVTLEGSHDGANWFSLATVSVGWNGGTAKVVDAPVRYVRGNLVVIDSAPGVPLTATIASA